MPRRQLASVRPQEKTQREVEDLRLVLMARNGDDAALDALVRRYTGFVRLKASSYFLAGGESDDLISRRPPASSIRR
jgi:RNA polymerase sporulation-specific sigma factor